MSARTMPDVKQTEISKVAKIEKVRHRSPVE